MQYSGPKGARLFKKVWVNDADMAIRAAVKPSGQSNNIRGISRKAFGKWVKAEQGHISLVWMCFIWTVPGEALLL